MNGRLRIEDLLKLRGFSLASCCPFCFFHDETLDHLFLQCSLAKVLWLALADCFRVSTVIQDSVFQFFRNALSLRFSSQLQALWLSGNMAIVWNIWTTRNSLKFRDEAFSIFVMFRNISYVVREVSIFGHGYMHHFVNDLLCLKRFGISGIEQCLKVQIPVFWSPPINGWYKVNTDGASRGNLRLAAWLRFVGFVCLRWRHMSIYF